MRVSIAVLLACVTMSIPPLVSTVSAGDGEDAQRLRAAVLDLRDKTFNHCIATMDFSRTHKHNGSVVGRQKGTLIIARSGSTVLTDSASVNTDFVHPVKGSPLPDRSDFVQYFMANGRRCIFVSYEPTKSGKRLNSVGCHTDQPYDFSLYAAMQSVYISPLVSEFGPTGATLVELVQPAPTQIQPNGTRGLSATYSTAYGRVVVETGRVGDRDVLTSATITQGPDDVYTSRAKDLKVGDLRKDACGMGEHGSLTSVVFSMQLGYKDAAPGRPFSTITLKEHSKSAENKEFVTETALRLVDYRSAVTDKAIEALRVPIPEGEFVSAIDPQYQSLTLTYRGGDVVREVDGAPLDQVIVETRSRITLRNRLLLLLAAGIAVVAAGASTLVYRRRGRRAMIAPVEGPA